MTHELPHPVPTGPPPSESENENRCPECGGHVGADPRHGERVCQSCGLVLSERSIDYGPEWRSFDTDDRGSRARTGAPLTESLHDRGLSTVVGGGWRDAAGSRIPAGRRLQIARIRRLNQRTTFRSGAARNLARAIAEIHRIASALGHPRWVAEQAIHLYRRAASKNLIRGRSIDGIAAASLYATCRLAGVPVDPDRLSAASHVDRRTLLRLHRMLLHHFELKARPASPQEHVARYASLLTLPPPVERRARELLDLAENKLLTSGRSPTGLAAAAVYVASQESGTPRTQKQVAEATGVTEVTVRHRSRELLDLERGSGGRTPSAAA